MKCAKCNTYISDNDDVTIFIRYKEAYYLCYDCGFEVMEVIEKGRKEDDACG
jgi:uncharacterized CHY-type Zn-finger protein